jgi:hypothetical protein
VSGEIDGMGNRFAVKRLDTEHQQLPIHRSIRPLRVAITIERHFLAGDAKLCGRQGPVRFDDDFSQLGALIMTFPVTATSFARRPSRTHSSEKHNLGCGHKV